MAGRYTVTLRPAAARDLQGLPRQIQERSGAKMDELTENARPSGCTKLKGSSDWYRVRVGDYRIIYAIDDAALLVTVLRIRHRGDAYR